MSSRSFNSILQNFELPFSGLKILRSSIVYDYPLELKVMLIGGNYVV